MSPAAEAQETKRVYRIGYLSGGSPATARNQHFLQGLRDLGYVEGRDFVMEYRWAEGHPDRFAGFAADLVRTQVDVIVTTNTPTTYAAMQATKTIPIVFGSAAAVVEKGIVTSLARPGGNVTGLTFQVGPLKLFQLLKEAAPKIARGVYLYDRDSASPAGIERLRSEAQAANVVWQSIGLRDDPNSIAEAFGHFARGTSGLVLDQSTRLMLKADHVCRIALQRGLPTIGLTRSYADAGCLMSYAENLNDMYRRAAAFVDRILKGAKPADLPVEQPTKFELVINLKTAKALGLTIPPSLLGRADEVIQ
ncbi:MAG TPA: ABC transporter substrate-binding protein [Terriglobales bacterium]|nr:ABC transporter substrate-binding protein [Terriglobales bacterium]